jgi:EAL domain-containing protein (putative c-di-GMP-specific phosphodiesterase class I)
MSLHLDSPDISRLHSEFQSDGDRLYVQDMDSTNGTFVNLQPITKKVLLTHGDIIHFADMEFRLIEENSAEATDAEMTMIGIGSLPNAIPQGLNELQELLSQSMTTVVLEAIVGSQDGLKYGYELLGRGCHPSLPAKPTALFQIAESGGLEVELSELFRTNGVGQACSQVSNRKLFVNTHPRELDDPARLLHSIALLHREYPSVNLVLEIHEEAATDLATIRLLKAHLQSLDVELAYDDFGAGQARLLELVEAPPDYLKFDIKFFREVESASQVRIHMVKALLQICREAKITSLAEGVSSQTELDFCQGLGFELLQGYFFE